MSNIYVERLDTAFDALKIYTEKALPVIPDAIETSQQRHLIGVEQKYITEWIDELVGQVEEVKNVRAAYTAELARLQGHERRDLEEQYREFITPKDLANFLKRVNRKVDSLRDLKKKCDRLLNQVTGPGRKNVALPSLYLTPFVGTNWEEFWPLFSSTIHLDTEMNQIQKMGYLDSLLRGEPKKILQGLTPYSDDNYATAVQLLEEKYGKKEFIIRDFHNQLAKLPSSKHFVDDLKLQLDVERICRQLEHHNQDLSSPQIYLSLEQKLSKKTLIRYVEWKSMKIAATPNLVWNTTLFREGFKIAVDFVQQVKETYHRGGPNAEKTNEKQKGPSRVKTEQEIKREE